MIPLNHIQVPKPCSEDWGAMDGDARRRFCAGCGCHVHDLSAMTRREAQELLDRTEGRVCVRFQTGADGSLLTQDIPAEPVMGRRVFWPRRMAPSVSWVVALALAGLGLTARADTVQKGTAAKVKPHVTAPAGKRPHNIVLGNIVLGRIMMPRPKPHTAPGEATRPQTTVGKIAVPPPIHTIAPPPPPPPTYTMGIVALPMHPHPAPKK